MHQAELRGDDRYIKNLANGEPVAALSAEYRSPKPVNMYVDAVIFPARGLIEELGACLESPCLF